MKNQDLSQKLSARLASVIKNGARTFVGDDVWQRQLRQWHIRAEEPQRIVTEGALAGTLSDGRKRALRPARPHADLQAKIARGFAGSCRLPPAGHAEDFTVCKTGWKINL